ncbi:hypothetical protein SDC9_100199 [bioreactor metagenome]|uniref:Uncharacterized protein n=1 Tax=bioreactor metagenome TaxID=1076179 RepID=A0A645AM76_9ZZZZ
MVPAHNSHRFAVEESFHCKFLGGNRLDGHAQIKGAAVYMAENGGSADFAHQKRDAGITALIIRNNLRKIKRADERRDGDHQFARMKIF